MVVCCEGLWHHSGLSRKKKKEGEQSTDFMLYIVNITDISMQGSMQVSMQDSNTNNIRN